MKWTLIGSWYLGAFATFLITFCSFLKAGWIFSKHGDIAWGMVTSSTVIFIILFVGATCGVSYQLKARPKDKIAEEIYDKKDNPIGLTKTVKKIGEMIDSNEEFNTAMAYKDGKPLIGITPRPGYDLKIQVNAKFNKEERFNELKKFKLGKNSHFEFSEDELKKFEVIIGKTVIKSAEQGKLVIDMVFPELPPMKLVTESPAGEYSCFEYIQFRIRQVKDGFVYWDNKDQDSTVIVEFAFNPGTKETQFAIDFVKLNRMSENYNIQQEIDFYEFQKNLLYNASLRFVNLENNSVLSETEPFIPVNVDFGKSIQNLEYFMKVFSHIRRIQNEFSVTFQIPEKITVRSIKSIKEIIDAIDGKEQVFNFNIFSFDVTYNEAKSIVSNLEPSEGFVTLFNNSSIELFGKSIQLGQLQITFPPCKIFPTNEEIELREKDKQVEIILKTIQENAQFTGTYLNFKS